MCGLPFSTNIVDQFEIPISTLHVPLYLSSDLGINIYLGESIGINVDNGELIDAADAQIYDHILVKDWQVRLGKHLLRYILKVIIIT